MRNFLLGLILTILVFLVGSFLFIYSGFYNVSTTIPHMKTTELAIHVLKDKSVQVNSKNINVPDLTNKELILKGYKGYDSMCVTCHAAPGKSASVIADGLYPKPPELYNKEIYEEWNEKELFWIIKNGIKLTGMPAYGPTHGDEDLWAIVAFLKQMPSISESEYMEIGKKTKRIEHIHKDGKKHVH